MGKLAWQSAPGKAKVGRGSPVGWAGANELGSVVFFRELGTGSEGQPGHRDKDGPDEQCEFTS